LAAFFLRQGRSVQMLAPITWQSESIWICRARAGQVRWIAQVETR